MPQAAPSLPVLTPAPLCLLSGAALQDKGWQGMGEQGGWGLSPYEARVEEGWGGCSAAVSLFPVHWFLLGTNPGNPVSWAKRASHPMLGLEGPNVVFDRSVRRGPVVSPGAPVGSGGRLLSGSSLSQDCARLVLLGFRGAVRRPRSEGPEMRHGKLGTQGGSQDGCPPRLPLLLVAYPCSEAWKGLCCGDQSPRVLPRPHSGRQ